MQENGNVPPSKAMIAATKAARGTLLIFIGNSVSTVILSLASVIIARLLGPSDYGLYSIALAVPSLMLLFTDFGINQALIRFLAKSSSEGRGQSIQGLTKVGIYFELATGLLAFLASLPLARILATHVVNRQGSMHLIQMASPAILGGALLATSSSIFVGLEQMEKTAMLAVLNPLVKVIAAPILVVLSFGVAGAIAGHALGFLVSGILGSLVALSICRYPKDRLDIDSSFTSNLVPMFKYGIPLYASTLIAGLLGNYHTIVLPWFTSNGEIGAYSVAIVFSSIVALLTTPISTALFPAFSKIDPKDHIHDLKEFFLHSLRYTLLLVMPASFFIAVTSGDLIPIFYGSRYVQACTYLRIYSATFILAGLSLVFTSFFNGIGRTQVSLKASLIQLSAAIPLSMIFTALYGIVGFIFSTIVSAACPIAYMASLARREHGLQFDSRRILRILVASLVSCFPTFPLTLLSYSHVTKLAMAAAVFCTVYSTVTPTVGAIEYEDLVNLRQISKGLASISKLSSIVLSHEERILSLVQRKSIDD